MYELTVMEQGSNQSQELFETFEDLKNSLIETDYFSWINDNVPERELPNFEDVEDIHDIQNIFEEYDYSWWTMNVEVVKGHELEESIIASVRLKLEKDSEGYYIENYDNVDDLLETLEITEDEYLEKIGEVNHEIVRDVPVITFDNPDSTLFNVAYLVPGKTDKNIIDELEV